MAMNSPQTAARIAVADDDRLVLSTLCAGLVRAGYCVEALHDGDAAVRLCEENPPDLIVLDHHMVGLSGLDAAERIRRQTDIPILMLTAFDDAELVQRAIAIGVNGYFVKPIDSSQLAPSIRLHLMRAGQAAGMCSPLANGLPWNDVRGAVPREGWWNDSLTGLPNRMGLDVSLEKLKAHYGDVHRQSACLCLDLDRFQQMTGDLGQYTADEFLKCLVGKLKTILRSNDVLARAWRDQFFVLLPWADAESAGNLARRLLEAVATQELLVGDLPITISACIGVTSFGGQFDSEMIIAEAYSALQEARNHGPNSVAFFQQGTKTVGGERGRTERLIRHALDNDRIGLEFQPILDIRTGVTTHYEALLRLHDEEGRLLSLPEFLPVAERYGLIDVIDYRVLELAVTHLAAFDLAGTDLSLSVNLSGVHFGDQALLRRIRDIMREKAITPGRLIFEITETAAVDDLDQARRFITELKALGCRFALDDFGAGYASFYYLKGLNVDYIKIDGAFIRDLAHTASDRLFVKAIVDVAKGMNVKTIAEYVTDEETLVLLRDYQVDYAQGFHIGRPGPLPVPTGQGRA